MVSKRVPIGNHLVAIITTVGSLHHPVPNQVGVITLQVQGQVLLVQTLVGDALHLNHSKARMVIAMQDLLEELLFEDIQNLLTRGGNPTPYTQDNRGRQANDHSSSSSDQCMRCGGAHASSYCRKYTFWEGPPCQQCGFMHDTRLHRARSTSAPKTSQPGYRKIQNYESEVIPGNFISTENPVNYFEKN